MFNFFKPKNTVTIDAERLKELEHRSCILDSVVDFTFSDLEGGELKVNLELVLNTVKPQQ